MRNAIIFLLILLATLCAAQAQFAVAVGGVSHDEGRSIVQTTDGGYIVAGYARSFTAGNEAFFIVKFDSTGSVSWSRAVRGSGQDKAYSIVQTTDGGFVVTGEIQHAYSDIFLVKIDSIGSVSWSCAVGGTSLDQGNSIVQTTDGGYAVVGCGDFNDLFLVKFDSTASISWSRAVRGTGDIGRNSIVQTIDSGFVVAGYTESYGAGGNDVLLVKFSVAGTVEWSRAVGGLNDDFGLSVVQTIDSGFVVAGYTESYGAGGNDVLLVKFSVAGTVEWSRAVGETEYDAGYSVVQTTDGGFAIAGRTRSYGTGESDLLLIKFDAEGNSCIGRSIIPTVTVVSPLVDTTFPSVAIPSLTLWSISPTVIVSSPAFMEICVDDIAETITKPVVLEISVIPNPFNSAVTITAPAGAEIEIFDLNGRNIAKFDDGTQVWKPEPSVGSGIYLVRATVGEQEITKRVVYLK